ARALNELTEPARALRGVQPVRIGRRSLEVINLPAPEEGAADVPLPACAIRSEDERALARADENSYAAHPQSFLPSAVDGLPRIVDRGRPRSTCANFARSRVTVTCADAQECAPHTRDRPAAARRCITRRPVPGLLQRRACSSGARTTCRRRRVRSASI